MEARIGPAPAKLDAPPAKSAPPPPPFRPKLIHFVAIALVLVALALPLYLLATSFGFRRAGLSGFVAIFFACLSIVVGAARLVTSRKRPLAAGLAILASCLGAAGLVVAGAGGHLARATAREIEGSDHAIEPALRAYQIAEAEAGGRASALLGLTNLFGFAFGFVLLLLVVRARREALPLVASAAPANAPRTGPVFAWLFGCALVFVSGLVVSIWAAVLEVRDAPHPRAALLKEAAEAAGSGSLDTACSKLDKALDGGDLPEEVLSESLPDAPRLADRCVTAAIEALPRGDGCQSAAEALGKKPFVELVDAKGRVKAACKR